MEKAAVSFELWLIWFEHFCMLAAHSERWEACYRTLLMEWPHLNTKQTNNLAASYSPCSGAGRLKGENGWRHQKNWLTYHNRFNSCMPQNTVNCVIFLSQPTNKGCILVLFIPIDGRLVMRKIYHTNRKHRVLLFCIDFLVDQNIIGFACGTFSTL